MHPSQEQMQAWLAEQLRAAGVAVTPHPAGLIIETPQGRAFLCASPLPLPPAADVALAVPTPPEQIEYDPSIRLFVVTEPGEEVKVGAASCYGDGHELAQARRRIPLAA